MLGCQTHMLLLSIALLAVHSGAGTQSALSSHPLQAAAPGPAQISRGIDAPALPLSTGGGPEGPTLLDQDGNEIVLKGLSVFGFNSV